MKVIQITDHMGSGGVNSFVYDLCMALEQAGADVTFIGLIDSKEKTAKSQLDELRNRGVQVFCLEMSSKKEAIIHGIPKLRKMIKKISKGDLCVCNLHLKLSVLCGVIATFGLKNVKCIETYHNTYHHYELQYAACYPFIKHYIAISKTCGEEMRNRFHTPERKLSVIPNGIDRDMVRKKADIESIQPHSGLRLISIGRMSFEKNLKKPVEALCDICCEMIQYCIIGDGPQRVEIEKAASENRCIEFTGWLSREETLRKLAESDVVIMPSLWEGRSILQLEAMALDKPMILSDVPALREVFDEEPLHSNETMRKCKWGYLVRTNDEDGYRMAVKKLASCIDEVDNMQQYVKSVSKKNQIVDVAIKYIDIFRRYIK